MGITLVPVDQVLNKTESAPVIIGSHNGTGKTVLCLLVLSDETVLIPSD